MPHENTLRDQTSPYLLQHADNPVHWQGWSSMALQEAQDRGCPVLLSVGYAACHWCHVMAHESFEDTDTASVMNALFVCIKVDREERPDIDQLYMTALHAMGEQGGWPLTMFLDGHGAPFWGGTYFPPVPSPGRPSFRQVLEAVANAYANDPNGIRTNADALIQTLARQTQPTPGELPDDAALAGVGAAFMTMTDPQLGGLRGAPKFPNPPIFRLLWQLGTRRCDGAMQDAVRLLLTRMAEGGIFDQLGGGFARYSTDPVWLVPHFEKMLYDNALLLDLLALAHAGSADPLYAHAATATVDWMLRDMRAQTVDGAAGFAASEDADSEGEEGRFYVWRADEVDTLLGARSNAFKAVYGVQPNGNWDGVNILHCAHSVPAERFAEERAVLLAAREQRVRPGRDDKVLADWNGLAIGGLARAACVFGKPAWLEAAVQAYRFVVEQMRQEDGAIAHAWRLGRLSGPGLLEDQASVARAALALFEATGAIAYLSDARAMVDVAQVLFGAPDGSFYMTSRDAADLPLGPKARPRFAADNATPSGNGMMADVLARLYHLTGEDVYRLACTRLIAAFCGGRSGLMSAPSLAAAADLLAHGACLVVDGDPNDAAVAALLAVGRATSDPSVCVRLGFAGLDGMYPASALVTDQREPAAYLCRDQRCSMPVRDSEALADLLTKR